MRNSLQKLHAFLKKIVEVFCTLYTPYPKLYGEKYETLDDQTSWKYV